MCTSIFVVAFLLLISKANRIGHLWGAESGIWSIHWYWYKRNKCKVLSMSQMLCLMFSNLIFCIIWVVIFCGHIFKEIMIPALIHLPQNCIFDLIHASWLQPQRYLCMWILLMYQIYRSCRLRFTLGKHPSQAPGMNMEELTFDVSSLQKHSND